MKTRAGFVSNSSSSSFLVALPKNQSSLYTSEVMELLFGKETVFTYYEYSYPVEAMASVIARDLGPAKLYPRHPYDYNKEDYKALMRTLEDHLLYQRKSEYNDRERFSPEFMWLWDALDPVPEYPEFEHDYSVKETDKERDARWKVEQKARVAWEKKARPMIKKLIKRVFSEMGEEYDFYMLRYADGDGPFFSAMEHGNIFNRVQHIRFSEH